MAGMTATDAPARPGSPSREWRASRLSGDTHLGLVPVVLGHGRRRVIDFIRAGSQP